jgi:phosphoglycolate phosphatase-like HAD superfamily hydrolase
VIRHVVWDWNGTLFDDFHVVVEAVNAGIEPLGLPGSPHTITGRITRVP